MVGRPRRQARGRPGTCSSSSRFCKLSANGHASGNMDRKAHSQQGSFSVLTTTSTSQVPALQVPDLCRAFQVRPTSPNPHTL